MEQVEYKRIVAKMSEDEIDKLLVIAGIVLNQKYRLRMDQWHTDMRWNTSIVKSAGDEIACGTCHCIAGWAQVLWDKRNFRPEIVNRSDMWQTISSAEAFGGEVLPIMYNEGLFEIETRQMKSFLKQLVADKGKEYSK